MTESPRLLLGSSSPRRREILDQLGVKFEWAPSPFDEESLPYRGDPGLFAEEISIQKALSFSRIDELVLCADTVVSIDGELLLKPRDVDEAAFFLQKLQGNWHTVYTGVSVKKGEKLVSGVEKTRVLFHPASQKQISRYIAKVGSLDKSGGYAIQGAGALIVSQIQGCFYNVMGLPIGLTTRLLKEQGMDLWDCLT